MPRTTRNLAAIMFTDIVGYSSLAQSNESRALEILEKHNKLLRPIFADHGGREVKTIGDSFLVEFTSALDATRCAIEIQKFLHEYNISTEEDWKVRLRIGLHVGDVVRQSDDILGDAVNIASRIQPLCEPGGICLTEQVYDQIRNKIDYSLERLERPELKNIHVPIDVYKMVLPWEEGGSAEFFTTTNNRLRIAILPFANISPDPSDEYFADGMTDELISTISKMKELKVISRTSVIRYKEGGGRSIRDIGRELEVGSVLEGSVRKAGSKIRITAQLIDVKSDEHLWSETFDRELEDIFGIQKEIAQRVTNSLKVELLAEQKKEIRKEPTGDTEAYTCYLKGRFFWNKRTAEWTKRAIEQFEVAIKRDPSFALAYSGLADCYLLMGRRGNISPSLGYTKAKQFALKALELDERVAEPHATLGTVFPEFEWNWKQGEKEFRRALELKPSYAIAHNWYALYLGHVGRFAEAIEEAKKAVELDPFSPGVYVGAAEAYTFAGEVDKALEWANKAIEIDPNFAASYDAVGYTNLWKGNVEESLAGFRKSMELADNLGTRGEYGYALAKSGRTGEATRVLDELLRKTGERPEYALEIGMIYIGLGQKETAIDWFEKACETPGPTLTHLKCDPFFKSVQTEPRFRGLLKNMALE